MKQELNELFVTESYMKDNEIFSEEIPLEKWSEIVSKKAISAIFELEEILSKELGRPIKLNKDFPHLRKALLNISGAVKRLPEGIKFKDIE